MAGFSGAWSVVFFNACPMLVLCPLIVVNRKQLGAALGLTIFTAVMIGLAFSLYANGLVETTTVWATSLYYLTPVWSTLIGIAWLSERLTKAQVVSIVMAFLGLILRLSSSDTAQAPLNIGDLFSFLSSIFWLLESPL